MLPKKGNSAQQLLYLASMFEGLDPLADINIKPSVGGPSIKSGIHKKGDGNKKLSIQKHKKKRRMKKAHSSKFNKKKV